MKFSIILSMLTLGLLAFPAFGAEAPYTSSKSAQSQWTVAQDGVQVAQRKKKRRKASNTGRERFITREARLKGKDQKNIDFGDVSIGGQRKTPMSQLITNGKANKDHDFIKIRLRWHPEMVQSASSLDAGSTVR